MLDARLAFTILASIGGIIGALLLISIPVKIFTGFDLFGAIIGFFYKSWDTILSIFGTMTYSAPPMVKIIIFTSLFWIFGSFILSSTVGLTHVCHPDDGILYDLSFIEGIGYAFLPDNFESTYTIKGSADGIYTYQTGWLDIGPQKTINVTSNLVDLSDPNNPTFVVPAVYDGDFASKWISKKSPEWDRNNIYKSNTFKGLGTRYPVLKFSLCKKTNEKGSLGSVRLQDSVCVLWEGDCKELSTPQTLDYEPASWAEVWKAYYGINYYQSSNGTVMNYQIMESTVSEENCKRRLTILGLTTRWYYSVACTVDISSCVESDNLTITWTPPTYLTTVDENLWTRVHLSMPLAYSRVVSDSGKVIWISQVENGTKVNSSGIVYNVANQPMGVAVADTGGGLFGDKKTVSLFDFDNKKTYLDSKVQFLEDRREREDEVSKNSLISWGCVKGSDDKYQTHAEIFIARLPIFSLKFILIVLVFTILFAVLGFINTLKR